MPYISLSPTILSHSNFYLHSHYDLYYLVDNVLKLGFLALKKKKKKECPFLYWGSMADSAKSSMDRLRVRSAAE